MRAFLLLSSQFSSFLILVVPCRQCPYVPDRLKNRSFRRLFHGRNVFVILFKAIEPLMHHQCKHILVILYKIYKPPDLRRQQSQFCSMACACFAYAAARCRALSADDGCGITESERIKTKT